MVDEVGETLDVLTVDVTVAVVVVLEEVLTGVEVELITVVVVLAGVEV